MTKTQLLRKVETMLDDAATNRTWGQIEIELRDGEATLLRRSITERLDADRERTRERFNSR